MQFHPVANLFPLMEGAELDALAADIKGPNGQIEDILTYNNQIIDGRNRYRACLLAGVLPRYREWSKQGPAWQFIVSLKLLQRNLLLSERAILYKALIPLVEAEDREHEHQVFYAQDQPECVKTSDVVHDVLSSTRFSEDDIESAMHCWISHKFRREIKRTEQGELAEYESVTRDGERFYKRLDCFDIHDFREAVSYYRSRATYFAKKANALAALCRKSLNLPVPLPFPEFGTLKYDNEDLQ
jgi:hypothetical protein